MPPRGLRRILGAVTTMTGGLAEPRNRGHGTGHGPATARTGLLGMHASRERGNDVVPAHVGSLADRDAAWRSAEAADLSRHRPAASPRSVLRKRGRLPDSWTVGGEETAPQECAETSWSWCPRRRASIATAKRWVTTRSHAPSARRVAPPGTHPGGASARLKRQPLSVKAWRSNATRHDY